MSLGLLELHGVDDDDDIDREERGCHTNTSHQPTACLYLANICCHSALLIPTVGEKEEREVCVRHDRHGTSMPAREEPSREAHRTYGPDRWREVAMVQEVSLIAHVD